MKLKKQHILYISLLTIPALLIANAGYAENISELTDVNFDSHFTIKFAKNITFEKTGEKVENNTTTSLNYANETEKINILYVVSAGAKDELVRTYEELAKTDPTTNITSANNTTIIHFNSQRDIGEINYHDMAIVGDNEKYILMQCDNESLMKTMAESVRFM